MLLNNKSGYEQYINEKIYLKPGMNDLSQKEWDSIKTHKWVDHLIKKGVFSLLEEKLPTVKEKPSADFDETNLPTSSTTRKRR